MNRIETENGITVWDYERLPQNVKDWMDEHEVPTSDLDWIAIVPPCYNKDQYIVWLQPPIFGCCDVKDYELSKQGHRLVVGYHS